MMKTLLIAGVALSLLGGTAAGAQSRGQWEPINQRQANLERRIDQGVRNGALTRPEAKRLRADFRSLAQLETRYRRSSGLDTRERSDLQRRFDALSARIRFERHDRQDRGGSRR
jgi:hypothetical protein